MNSLGSRIRQIRGAESQETFAARIGVSKGSIGGYERDENSPSADVILKICSKANISVEWLMTGRGAIRAAAMDDSVATSSPRPATQLDAKLERVEAQRDDLLAENRRLHQENAVLLRQNGDLRERIARLEGALGQLQESNHSLFDERRSIRRNERL
ncbi:helix-turn-helix transcriptional regulator [uncultured Desulfovibrio sp.]|uniref:helix-turn-helix domain-containing protein n=1 Tax=uncultured Desulfovibrio sp. TaxID=167968 RepID=UPI00263420F9|nr:helix-turn-helix transcriptional regulator [uncultured Desulfovibrio sp.]